MLIPLIKLLMQLAVGYFVIKFVLKSLKGSHKGKRSARRSRKAHKNSVKAKQYKGEADDSLVTLLTHRFLNYRERHGATESAKATKTLTRSFEDEEGNEYSETTSVRFVKPAPKTNRRLSPWGGTVDSSEDYDD